MAKTSGALEGIRVIELGSLIAGPFAGRILADHGAEVIKVEPVTGDPLRKYGALIPQTETSYWFTVQARNKKLVAIDLKRPEGQDIARRLIATADVVVENFRPGRLEGWNLAPDDLRRMKPELIIARISGFGQTGPYKSLPGFGNIAEAMGGIRDLTGYPDQPPARTAVSLGDAVAGLFTSFAVLAALNARRQTGVGNVIDVSLLEAVFSLLEGAVPEYVHAGVVRRRVGTKLPTAAPSGVYPTQDGKWISIGANGDGLFVHLAEVVGRRDWANDPRLKDNVGRVAHSDELDRVIADWTASHGLEDIRQQLWDAGVPAGPVYDIRDIMADPHYQARNAFIEVASSVAAHAITMPSVVPLFSDTPGQVHWGGGRLGEHTAMVLRELVGLTVHEVAHLSDRGVVVL